MVRLERFIVAQNAQGGRICRLGECGLFFPQRMLVGGAGQVLQQDVRIVRVQPGPFDWCTLNEFRVIDQVLIDRRVARREDDDRS